MKIGIYSCVIACEDAEEDTVLQECDPEVDESHGEAVCWVPSVEGRPFRMECSFGGTLKGKNAVHMVLSADGEILDTRIAVEPAEETTMNGIRLDSWTILPYTFKPAVKPTEDFDEDEMKTEDAVDIAWKQRGVITLEMTRVEAVAFEPLADDKPSSRMVKEDRLRTIEVGKKDVSPKKAARRTVSWNWGTDEPKPCATFHFKHRPKEWLQAYGFMPRDAIDKIDFDLFNLDGQPEYLTNMKQMTIQDEVMS